MRWLLTLVLCSLLLSSSAIASGDPDRSRNGGPRLRARDPRISELLQTGMARSATMRSLVERIEASNVIVYIALNPLLKPTLSGALTWMTEAGPFRYVRASISRDLTPNQMIATLAHELQHVVEVVEDETVRDEGSLVALYRRIGHQNRAGTPGWETVAAQQAGYRVQRELVAS